MILNIRSDYEYRPMSMRCCRFICGFDKTLLLSVTYGGNVVSWLVCSLV